MVYSNIKNYDLFSTTETKFNLKAHKIKCGQGVKKFGNSIKNQADKDIKSVLNLTKTVKTELSSKKHIAELKKIAKNLYQYIFTEPFHQPKTEQKPKQLKIQKEILQNNCYFEIDEKMNQICENYILQLTEEQQQHRKLYQKIQNIQLQENQEAQEIYQNKQNKDQETNIQILEDKENEPEQEYLLQEENQEFQEILYQELLEYIQNLDNQLKYRKQHIQTQQQQLKNIFGQLKLEKNNSFSEKQLKSVQNKIYQIIEENGKEEFQDYWQCYFENLYIKC
ncbi:hypothetical protein PPERSA_08893 [Pseudocohnilembus persalinus]|uniref:Uncharacterized protein n=1 Tax=Pseudocohnilembus persalinus TaxID=266149 RepID=A0A0V0QE77_PSEPJ|nr:hypothetical protein PPERSA_08893 [Pseudocohnilembus persalinus]|eukprot:KRX00500.1 hypothetical protein PPERSA_08893 [Pseudocohnilembus persalinus]